MSMSVDLHKVTADACRIVVFPAFASVHIDVDDNSIVLYTPGRPSPDDCLDEIERIGLRLVELARDAKSAIADTGTAK